MVQMAANHQPIIRMDHRSKRDSKPIRQYWTVPTEICCRMRFLDLSNRMIRQIVMANSNLWVSVINKIKLHPRRLQQVVNERSKQIQLMLTNYKDQHRLKVIPNHRQPKKLAVVEDPKSTALALEQITMLVLSELAHLTTDNSIAEPRLAWKHTTRLAWYSYGLSPRHRPQQQRICCRDSKHRSIV